MCLKSAQEAIGWENARLCKRPIIINDVCDRGRAGGPLLDVIQYKLNIVFVFRRDLARLHQFIYYPVSYIKAVSGGGGGQPVMGPCDNRVLTYSAFGVFQGLACRSQDRTNITDLRVDLGWSLLSHD